MNHGNQALESNLTIGEIIALLAYLVSNLLALIVAYNIRLRKNIFNGQPFYSFKTEQRLLLLSKGILFLIVLYFFYIAYTNYRDKNKSNEADNNELIIQLISSTLLLVESILTAYIVLTNYNTKEEFENSENKKDSG